MRRNVSSGHCHVDPRHWSQDPLSAPLVVQKEKVAQARSECAAEATARAAHVATVSRDLAKRLQAARASDRAAAALNQVKQSMAAPDWEIDDFEWWAHLPWSD